MLFCAKHSPKVGVVEGDLQLCRINKYGFFVHSLEESGRSGSRNHNCEELDCFLKSMGLTSIRSTCEGNRPDRPQINCYQMQKMCICSA
jgi:hypothetical protein